MHETDPRPYRLHLYVIPIPTHESEAFERTRNETGWSRVSGAFDSVDSSAHVTGVNVCRYDPPLRLERLSRNGVIAAAKLAQALFVLPALPQVGWNATHCWLDCFSMRLDGINDPLFRDADDLLQALPYIQAWMDEWAHSPSRKPKCDPRWAVERDIDREEVARLAEFVVGQLATETCLTLDLCSDTGAGITLKIPPKATLRLPPATENSRRVEEITAKEEYTLWATPTGTLVFVPAEIFHARSGSLPVDVAALSHLRVTYAAAIRPVTGLTEGAKDAT